jgi:hypothetical protein
VTFWSPVKRITGDAEQSRFQPLPGSPGFLGGLHAVALVTAALFLAGVVASLVAIPAGGE